MNVFFLWLLSVSSVLSVVPSLSLGVLAPWRFYRFLSPRLKQLRGLPQVIDRPLHALPDRQLGLPSQRTDLRRIQEDEGTVADPSALAAGVASLRTDAQLLADPAE